MQLKINSKLPPFYNRQQQCHQRVFIISHQIRTEKPKESHWTGLKKIVRKHVSVVEKISYLHFCIMSRFKLSHCS
jgi:hypothetical protein